MQDDLQKQYLASLAERLEELKAFGRQLQQGTVQEGTVQAEQKLRTLAHSLHGSGGTFGFPQISEAARAAEQCSTAQLPQKIADLVQVIQQIITATPSRASDLIDILIIDDDTDFANALENGFVGKSSQYRVSLAATGASAQELLVKRKFALILLDLVLPDRDGRDLLKEIKYEFNLVTPVYVLSGIDRDMIRVECMALGAEKFITKPVDMDALVNTIDKMLKKTVKRELSLVPMGHELQQGSADKGLAAMTVSAVAVSGMAVMVAEDDAMQGNLVRQRLQREGLIVDVVNNGQDAVTNMRDKPYAVYILDVNMPGMNGFEVLQRIRKDPVAKNTPVIMLTAMGSESDILRAYELGTNDYILKPFSAIQLVARVKTLLKLSQ
jgi:DNA-binding response OmpR family regulator